MVHHSSLLCEVDDDRSRCLDGRLQTAHPKSEEKYQPTMARMSGVHDVDTCGHRFFHRLSIWAIAGLSHMAQCGIFGKCPDGMALLSDRTTVCTLFGAICRTMESKKQESRSGTPVLRCCMSVGGSKRWDLYVRHSLRTSCSAMEFRLLLFERSGWYVDAAAQLFALPPATRSKGNPIRAFGCHIADGSRGISIFLL